LSEAGIGYLADCRRILGEIEEAEASAAGAHAQPRGQIGVTAPIMFGRMHVAPILLDFLARYPEMTARAVLVDRVVDLMDEGLDVAVRIADLPDSSLSAMRVGSVRWVVCASPDYLSAHGVPQTPADLPKFSAIVFAQAAASSPWSFASARGAVTVRPPTQLIVNTADVAIAAAVAGRGLTRVLSYQIAPALHAGQLAVVLEEFEPQPLPIHVVHREGTRAAARVRAFVDFAVDRLRRDRALNAPAG
jgi:DNA-binding transcriptional LysR family regulator